MKSLKPRLLALAALSLAIALGIATAVGLDPPPATPPAATSPQDAITKKAEAFVDAFHKGDANALAAFWTPDCDYRDLAGRTLHGRKAIADEFTELFKENKGLKLRIEVHSVRFPTPDTAIETGVTSVLAEGQLPNRAHYHNLWVKKDNQWLLASVVESPFIPPSNYEHLRPLEWVIGEWVQDTKDPHVGRVQFDWADDRNFIIGLRAVGIKDVLLDNGSQRIGWDAAAKTIRSWNFESDGGFGHGAWSLEGDKWTIKMSSVLNSGSILTATTLVTRVDPDTITWQSKDQRLDGKPIADTPLITMKRVP
jgi:uncharacterized protein (TIGR02246 family)